MLNVLYEIEQLCEEEFKVIFRTYEIPGCSDGYDFNDIVKIRLHKMIMDTRQTDNIKSKDDHRLICKINGMLVDDISRIEKANVLW